MPEGPITRQELWHANEQLERQINAIADRLERRIDSLHFVSRTEFEEFKKDNDRRHSETEGTVKWGMRLIAGLPFAAAGAAATAMIVAAM